jgi:CubicO group peptidase (beta-lactamase class C family)
MAARSCGRPSQQRPGIAGDRPLADPAALQRQLDRVRTWHGASGLGDLRANRPARAADRFRIGSVTKSFVATLVLQLVGEGRLRLDDNLERWLPGLVPGGRRITVRQLRNHTSGLSNYTDDLPEPPRRFRPRKLVAIATGHRPAAGRPAGAAHSRASGARRHRAADHPAGTCWPTGRCPYSSSSPWPRAVIPERDARHCRTAALVAASSVRSRRW